MLHTNAAELRLLFDTFSGVWSSGGQTNLSLETKDSQVWAKLEVAALDYQRLERGEELSLGTPRNSHTVLPIDRLKIAVEDQQLEQEMPAVAKIGWRSDKQSRKYRKAEEQESASRPENQDIQEQLADEEQCRDQ